VDAFDRSDRVRASRFVRYATVACVAIVVYASLHPLTGWRAPAPGLLAERLAAWPRYYAWSDVLLNVAGYIPLSLLATLWLRARFAPLAAGTLAVVLCTVGSVSMECLQAWLPIRVPSGLDVFCNAVGALLGAWSALALAETALLGDDATRWRERVMVPGARADVALALLALWAFAQAGADPWLFAAGRWPRPSTVADFGAWDQGLWLALEAAITAVGLLALAGIVGAAVRRHAVALLVASVLVACAVKTLLAVLWWGHDDPWNWVSPGRVVGASIGLAGAAAVLGGSPARARAWGLGGVIAMVALLNLAPTNPYLAHIETLAQLQRMWGLGGTIAMVSCLWPAGALLLLALPPRPSSVS
jgi:VanZ family protein